MIDIQGAGQTYRGKRGTVEALRDIGPAAASRRCST